MRPRTGILANGVAREEGVVLNTFVYKQTTVRNQRIYSYAR